MTVLALLLVRSGRLTVYVRDARSRAKGATPAGDGTDMRRRDAWEGMSAMRGWLRPATLARQPLPKSGAGWPAERGMHCRPSAVFSLWPYRVRAPAGVAAGGGTAIIAVAVGSGRVGRASVARPVVALLGGSSVCEGTRSRTDATALRESAC